LNLNNYGKKEICLYFEKTRSLEKGTISRKAEECQAGKEQAGQGLTP